MLQRLHSAISPCSTQGENRRSRPDFAHVWSLRGPRPICTSFTATPRAWLREPVMIHTSTRTMWRSLSSKEKSKRSVSASDPTLSSSAQPENLTVCVILATWWQGTSFSSFMVTRTCYTPDLLLQHEASTGSRAEERRVGKECRSRWSPDQ